ncbi:MAG: hypothetical protein CXZ00_15510 [Acidobacteria bacterium]|nr:MAG: hypothetical protein CXZ00_15510 [Acidobacteriota bacterium]
MAFCRKSLQGQRGQILILCAISMIILILFVGLAVDFGLAYVTKARLGKAVDAAALAGARNLYQGQTQATAIAKSSFAMNYGSSNFDASTPILNVTYTTDADDNKLINVTANATIKTFFIALLPQFKTLKATSSAQSTRAHVLLTLVLDKSGSMQNNGGWSALPPAVNTFISYFDDTVDSVAVVTFASNVSTDVAMQTGGFKTKVKNLTAKMNYSYFGGATFSDGGLQQGLIQNNSITVSGNVVKVVVFFTDGYANTIQDTLSCGGGHHIANGLWNFGGYDSPSQVGFMYPTGTDQTPQCTGTGTSCCNGKFPSHATGKLERIKWNKVSDDSEYRAIQTSNTMRSDTNNMIVYSIGLGSNLNKDFLYQIANDPNSSTYDSTKPVGQAAFAPTAADLQVIFQSLASKILLRLTH